MFKNRPTWNFFKRLFADRPIRRFFSRKATLAEHEELKLEVTRMGRRMRDYELKH